MLISGVDKVASYYEGELYHRDVIPIRLLHEMPHHYYLLAIINSKLISWYHLKQSLEAQKGLFPKLLVTDLKNIPIRPIEIDNSEDTKINNEIF